jgi:proteasome lid subunit RPN8/RPN11
MLPSSLSRDAGRPAPSDADVALPSYLLDRLLRRARAIHEAGLKSFGLLVADPRAPEYPYCATDVVFFDPTKNRRNDPGIRQAFEAQGDYFKTYDDAGFVADSGELLAVHQHLDASGLEPVAMFHTHRRQPANFSHIDYRLHNPAYPWHLIIALTDPQQPVVRAFKVDKDLSEFGIDRTDNNQDSESDYDGPQVTPVRIVLAPKAA